MFSVLDEIKKGSLLIDFDEKGYSYCFTIYNEGNAVTIGGYAPTLSEVAAAIREFVDQEAFDEYVNFFGLIGLGGLK